MKIWKKVLVVFAVLLLVVVGIGFANYYPMLRMNPLESGKVEGTEITAVRNNINNLFVLDSPDGYLVIDAGTEQDKVAEELAQLGIEPEAVAYVLLTHTDYDHVGALPLFTNAELYLSEDEVQMIDGTTRRNPFQQNSIHNYDPEKVYLLKEQQELELGGHSIVCIKTPGHTPGSMSFLIDDQYLFTGDAWQIRGDNISVHPYSMDKAQAKSSIETLKDLDLDDKLILSAHYGIYRMNK